MSKRLKYCADDRLYTAIKSEPQKGEAEYISFLREWLYDVHHDERYQTADETEAEWLNFIRANSNKKTEKSAAKAGYDIYAVMHDIYVKETGAGSQVLLAECDRLKNEISRLKAEGMQAVGDSALKAALAKAEETAKNATGYASALKNELEAERARTAELTRRLQNTPNGGRKMSEELTQWEYKTMRTVELRELSRANSLDTSDSIDKELNRLGENGWEVTGTLPNENGEGRILMKRPKQKAPDYGYSR